MRKYVKLISRGALGPLLLAVSLCAGTSLAQTPQTVQASKVAKLAAAPDLDLQISYYSRVLTAEGVSREARYQDKMLRRTGHVWLERIVPQAIAHQDHDEHAAGVKKVSHTQQNEKLTEHKHFNPVLIPRHVQLENGKARIEFIDKSEKMTVSVPPSEFNNVNFDGSWENSFYLIDPQLLKSMKPSSTPSGVDGAIWYEREKNGIFQKVLWHAQKQIPLKVESGDRAGTFFQSVEVKIASNTQAQLPWVNLKGYIHKEYADFLD